MKNQEKSDIHCLISCVNPGPTGAFWYNLAIQESFPLTRIMKHCVDAEPFREYRPLKDMSAEFRLFKSQNPD